MLEDVEVRSQGRFSRGVVAACLALAVLLSASAAVALGGGRDARRNAASGGTETSQRRDPTGRSEPREDRVPGFTEGRWSVTVAAAGTVSVSGPGAVDVSQGVVTGSFVASGTGAASVETPLGSCSAAGTWTLTDGTISGSATQPTIGQGLHFSGTATCPKTGSRAVDTAYPGTCTHPVDVVSATRDIVVGTWSGSSCGPLDSVTESSFVAIRESECPKSARKARTLDARIANGTAEAPTRAQVDVDETIEQRPELRAQLHAAIAEWNATLAGAGRHIELVLGSDGTQGPVVHVGVDGPSMRAKLPSADENEGKPYNRPVREGAGAWTQTFAWTDRSGRRYGAESTDVPEGVLYTTEAAIRLNGGGFAGGDWSDLAKEDPQGIGRHVFLHELGHVLGLADQTGDPDDIMFESTSPGGHHALGLSCSDIATLQSL